ncbi:MAG: class I SAM-dependent methyltransferase [Bacteroidetes bacterium]|nr:class I SAM-dependent methyltransferase [Bacteroidota bacterium]
MNQISNCPICKNPTFTPFLTCKDYTVSNENFTIVNCTKCSFKFTNPTPNFDVLGNYYKSEDYISHSNTSKGLISKLYKTVRNYTLKNKLKLVEKHVSRGTLLDYGCGTGMFLNVCKQNGWKVCGMEPDAGASKIATEMGLNVFSDKNRVNTYTNHSKFNVITLWHVLEHVTDLNETLTFFKENLDNNGVLILALPNYKSYDANYYKEHWAAYDVPRHLYHFDVNTIQNLLKLYGFSLVESLPMKFDSFYVSMLSEKYKTGKINYFKAFLTGLQSNLKAKSANDYSSTVYVFKNIK